MRMFLYYAAHSFVNQVKKIFKSWVVIFILVCFVLGAGIGLFAAKMSEIAENNKAQEEVQESQEDEEEEDEEPAKESEFAKTMKAVGKENFLELIAGAVILLMLCLSVVNADKNAGKIFLPADVSLLFSAPLKPQSVMLFRIGMQIGTMIFMGVYLLLQLPNLVLNMGLSVWAGIAIIVAFSIMTFLSTLMQLLAYLLASKYEVVKKYLRKGLVVVLTVIAGGFLAYQKSSGEEMLQAFYGHDGK